MITALSLPPRERGLKQLSEIQKSLMALSLPPRERGLKQPNGIEALKYLEVAPTTGAWIETAMEPLIFS